MQKRLRAFLIGGCLIGAGCVDHNHLAVRSIQSPGATAETGKALLAHARGEFALGNVGLALESFQTFLREQPNDPEPYEGIAACYAAMGRYDLTRTNLEVALAYSPTDPRILNEYSAALEALGERAQAGQVRAEADRLRVAAETKMASVQSNLTPIGVPRVGSVTMKLPGLSRPAGTDDNRSSHAAPNQLAILAAMNAQSSKTKRASVRPPAQSRVQATGPSPAARLQSNANQRAAMPVAEELVPHSAPASAPQSALQIKGLDSAFAWRIKQTSIDNATIRGVELAAAKQGSLAGLSHRFRSPSAQEVGVDEPLPRASAIADMRREDAPHLERTSPGEVALFTGSPKTKWSNIKIAEVSARLNAASPASLQASQSRKGSEKTPALASLRWVPIKSSAGENVQLLNAARRQGLAADVRTTLLDRGWRKIGIGNAAMIKARTVILYGKSRTQLAYRLAAQFRCKAQKIAGLKKVIVLLGRDAIRRQSSSARA